MPIKRAALYVRVSSTIQAQEGDSIPAQLDALRRYASDHGMIVVGEYVDDGVSGTRSDRDELNRLLSDIDRIDILLVTKLDRLYRSIRHYLNLMDTLDSHGVGWLAIWEPIYDTTTPQGRLIVNQMMSIAQFEAENTGQRIRQVFAYKTAQHEVVTGKCPPGYRIDGKHMVPGEDAGTVREAFDTFLTTGSINAVLRLGLPGLPRSHGAMKKLLRNRTYIGERHGIKGFCEPIIDQDTFEAVQRQLPMAVKISTKRTYIFSGLLRCAECDKVMAGNFSKGRKTYRCALHFNRKPPACHNAKVVHETKLEREMMSRIRPMIEGRVLEYEVKQQNRVRPNKQKIERKLSRLKDLYVNDLIDLDEYRRDKSELEALLLEPEPVEDVTALRQLLETDIETLYWGMTPEEKRVFWRSIIRSIEWTALKETRVNLT